MIVKVAHRSWSRGTPDPARRAARIAIGARDGLIYPGECWRLMMAYRRAVFLDKDGTIIENVPYNVDPERIRLNPGAEEGLRRLHRAGYPLFVVSNQAG